ncbi:unnamed protein product [Plutella xylostella]|uniref:alpha-1,2-Mannosidase n=1 Tax=Plutella xylostella TaxID=51655 RepID=A0A8S4GDM5_PLUXY|nr:unnamed protein product [Plutella xylostella]
MLSVRLLRFLVQLFMIACVTLSVIILLFQHNLDSGSSRPVRDVRAFNVHNPGSRRAPSISQYLLIESLNQTDQELRQKRQTVAEMMKHAWNNYKLYAWGKNELKPLSKRAHLASVFGAGDLGATIVDGLDTLYIMGMTKEFQEGRDWVANNLRIEEVTKEFQEGRDWVANNLRIEEVDGFDTLYIMGMTKEFQEGRDWVANNLRIEEVDSDLSVFETTIRFVGGLLSCYALTGDSMFKDKAVEVADALLPAFKTPTGLPYALINPSTKVGRQYHWAGPNSILSEIGTLHMEFTYLSAVTGNEEYKNKVDRIREVLNNIEKPDGLYPNFINPRSGQWGQRHMSLGALGDSFYEYLLKAWLVSNQGDAEARVMFDEAMEAALDKMLRVSPSGLSYLVELKYGRVFEEKMDHLSCFAVLPRYRGKSSMFDEAMEAALDKMLRVSPSGLSYLVELKYGRVFEEKMDHLSRFAGGMFALASTTLENRLSERYMDVARKLTDTCHESYARSETKLGPEAFRFTNAVEARAQKSNEKVYLLRPETFESYFIMWRLTKDQKYRDWGWDAVQALESHCRVEGGYTGLVNVYHAAPQGDDVQQSFFLAETLKYLYLLFADDSLLPLDQWVFNTEAHPFPVKGKNALYREANEVANAP